MGSSISRKALKVKGIHPSKQGTLGREYNASEPPMKYKKQRIKTVDLLHRKQPGAFPRDNGIFSRSSISSIYHNLDTSVLSAVLSRPLHDFCSNKPDTALMDFCISLALQDMLKFGGIGPVNPPDDDKCTVLQLTESIANMSLTHARDNANPSEVPPTQAEDRREQDHNDLELREPCGVTPTATAEAVEFFIPHEEHQEDDATPFSNESCDGEQENPGGNVAAAVNVSASNPQLGQIGSTRNSSMSYPFRSKTGITVIISTTKYDAAAGVTDRQQSDGQAGRLTEVLQSFRFVVELLQNLPKDELVRQLCGIKRKYKKDFRSHSVFLCVLMGHGKCGQYMCSDGQLIKVQEITDRFSEERIHELNGVPKIFIVQTCQSASDSDHSQPMAPQLPIPGKNMCIQYTTTPGGYDHDHLRRGSIFISNFIRNLSEHGTSLDLYVILQKTAADSTKEVQKYRELNLADNWLCEQLPVRYDTLQHLVYLVPVPGVALR